MKKSLSAIALAASAFAIAPTALAITFPSLTTIYLASGVEDDGGAEGFGTATAITCSNVSGVSTSIRVLILRNNGSVETSHTFSNVLHGQTVRASTHTTFLANETNLATGGVDGGVINVESLQSGVFCTFTVLSAEGPASGFPLNTIRVNPHPGTVE